MLRPTAAPVHRESRAMPSPAGCLWSAHTPALLIVLQTGGTHSGELWAPVQIELSEERGLDIAQDPANDPDGDGGPRGRGASGGAVGDPGCPKAEVGGAPLCCCSPGKWYQRGTNGTGLAPRGLCPGAGRGGEQPGVGSCTPVPALPFEGVRLWLVPSNAGGSEQKREHVFGMLPKCNILHMYYVGLGNDA